MLERYERIAPGAAERIIAMAERQAEHRHQQEKRLLDAQVDDRAVERTIEKRGQTFGLLIGLGAFAGTVIIVLCQPNAAGVITGGVMSGGTIVALVTAFIRGRKAAEHSD